MLKHKHFTQVLTSKDNNANKSKVITSIKQSAAENSIWQPSKRTSARIKEEKVLTVLVFYETKTLNKVR